MSSRVGRRRQPTPASRLRPYWILAVLIGALLGVGVVLLLRWEGFNPRQISVEGNKEVTSEAIVSAAAIDMHQNLWLQNVAAMQHRIEEIPYVDLARVNRYLPARVVIVVSERFPIAILHAKNGEYLLDQRLRTLDVAPAGSTLPRFDAQDVTVGAIGDFEETDKLAALRDDAIALSDAHIDAFKFTHDKYGDLVVRLRGGVTIEFGDESDLAKKIPLIAPILEQAAKAKRPVATIDVRSPSAPIVIYKK